ncbi:hypothetical protein BDZ89DRAFT_1070606 [Hymenopellis radicata]|nr:hypothetical protein BDZ89DRAFT_1070606 [Hymenopellis radicata]
MAGGKNGRLAPITFLVLCVLWLLCQCGFFGSCGCPMDSTQSAAQKLDLLSLFLPTL